MDQEAHPQSACRWLFAYPYAVGSVMYTAGASMLLCISWINHPNWKYPADLQVVRSPRRTLPSAVALSLALQCHTS